MIQAAFHCFLKLLERIDLFWEPNLIYHRNNVSVEECVCKPANRDEMTSLMIEKEHNYKIPEDGLQ
jgi:hypothetical protein